MEYSYELHKKYYKIEFRHPVRFISSAPFNGGFGHANIYVNREVPKSYNSDPAVEIEKFLHEEDISAPLTVVTMTAVNVSTLEMDKRVVGAHSMEIYLTAGFENAVSIGNRNHLFGTVNLCLVTDLPLSNAASVNLLQSMVEAKSQCMNDFEIRDMETGNKAPGTSTDTASIFISSEETNIKYAGRITEYGYHASELVYNALTRSILKNKI
ncbi:MAG: adenosylcobinamide amidohydrolase [Thermoplasmatales archaeon]|nr:adenosylcobinamide amidohydrolase [Thermoplasmatales archaeon]MCW6170190.1 adenosylcobinamide amidohydrolase [Thermoplasmatales archaeon]